MALGEKYRVHVDHQFGGDSRYVQIYAEGYSGGVTELTGTGMPAVLDYPGSDNAIFDPILGSELSVNIWNLTADQFEEFRTAGNLDYLAILYNDTIGVIEWMGWLLPSEQEEPWNQAPYETELIFNCGLGLLEDHDYLDTDGSYFIGRETIKDIVILDILSKLYPSSVSGITKPSLRNACSLLESTMSLVVNNSWMVTTILDRNKYVNEDGTVWNCLDVLRDILTISGSRLYMGERGWWLFRLRDYSLFYDSYDIPYQEYLADGSFNGSSDLGAAELALSITGPQARSTMVGWVDGSQRVRYERAFKEIRLRQYYGYSSMILLGSFDSENWEDFWDTSGSPVRAQDADGGYYIRLSPGVDDILQTIEGLDTTVTPDQLLILSFEAMVEYPDTYTQTEFVFDIELKYDDPSNTWYLDGQQGSNPDDALWVITTVHEFLFTTENGLPSSGKWTRFELNIPKLPSDGDLRITFKDGQASGGAGTHTATGYRNISLLGTYDLEAMTRENNITLEIASDNLDIMPIEEYGLGDITEQENEGKYWNGAFTTDEDGLVPTILWYSTRRDGANRHRVGPIQPILNYVQDGYAVQNGIIRKRLSGRLVMDTHRWPSIVISEDSIYYVFTKLTIDLKRGECDVSMLELPEAEDMGASFVLGWTNNDFDIFTSTDDLITSLSSTGSGKYADADDAISYNAYDRFRVTVDGTMTASGFQLAWGGYNLAISDGYDQEIIPAAAGSTTPRLSATVGTALSMTNVTITIKKKYGY